MDKNSKIYVSGHKGLVGSSIVRLLIANGYNNIITKSRSELDLTDNQAVELFFDNYKPEYVLMAAAKVGGIQYNKNYPADFIRDNLSIQNNVIDTSYRHGVKKLCFLGSACIYPKLANVPISESSLLTGPLEETNEAYSIAKISGYFMCKKYTEQYNFNTISLMPANLYGINDNFRPQESHVIPALIKKFVDAKKLNLPYVKNFGDGSCTREFLHVDDLADAILFLMSNYNDPSIINIGTGTEVSIKEVCDIIKNIIGYNGDIVWDTTYPNGTPRRFLNISKITDLGWKPKISLTDGLKSTIEWYLNNQHNISVRS
jgi:GDP-L-fucose synthase